MLEAADVYDGGRLRGGIEFWKSTRGGRIVKRKIKVIAKENGFSGDGSYCCRR